MKTTLYEAARYLDAHGYDCRQATPTRWDVQYTTGKVRRISNTGLRLLYERVREQFEGAK